VIEGEPFRIDRSRAPWYPPPLYEWKTGQMQDKEQTDFVLSQRVQLDSDTGMTSFQLHATHARSFSYGAANC